MSIEGRASAVRKLGNRYRIGRSLASSDPSSSHRVKYGMDLETGQPVAISIYSFQFPEAKFALLNRNASGAKVYRKRDFTRLEHRNIVGIKDVFLASTDSKHFVYIITDLVVGEELFGKLSQAENGRLNEMESREYFRQLIFGLAHGHALGVCHWDLRPENLLLEKKMGAETVKVTGLGTKEILNQIAKASDNNNSLITPSGQPQYSSPESLTSNTYSGYSSDIWSCGVILYALNSGCKRHFHFPTIMNIEFIFFLKQNSLAI